MLCTRLVRATGDRAGSWLCSLTLTLTLTLTQERVAAHGLAPAAVAVVAQDAQGPRIVRLPAGLALRQTGGDYRFVCPALWGDADSLPAYALPDQPVLVLSSTGLWLLHDDGRVTRHPDPGAEGYAFDLAAQGGKLFVLRTFEKTGSEIIQVAGAQITSIWRDAALWTSLTAGTEFLAVARLTDDDRLVQQKLTPEGLSLGGDEGKAPAGTVNVLARGAGSELYLAIAYSGGRQLGQLDADGWKPLHSANAAIAGPVQHEDGSVYVALDGSLARLENENGALAPLEAARGTRVTCLGCYERQCYACTPDGILSLDGAGLGAASFDLSKLVAPVLTGLDQETATSCDLQWQHLRFDLLALAESRRDGAAGAVAAISGNDVAGAGGAQHVAGSGATAGSAPKPAAHGGGCSSVQPGRKTASDALALYALVLSRGLRRRRR